MLEQINLLDIGENWRRFSWGVRRGNVRMTSFHNRICPESDRTTSTDTAEMFERKNFCRFSFDVHSAYEK